MYHSLILRHFRSLMYHLLAWLRCVASKVIINQVRWQHTQCQMMNSLKYSLGNRFRDGQSQVCHYRYMFILKLDLTLLNKKQNMGLFFLFAVFFLLQFKCQFHLALSAKYQLRNFLNNKRWELRFLFAESVWVSTAPAVT